MMTHGTDYSFGSFLILSQRTNQIYLAVAFSLPPFFFSFERLIMKFIVLALLLIPASCFGQIVTLESNGHSAMGFNTGSGFITVSHFPFSSGFSNADIDIKIDSVRVGKQFEIGNGLPAYFFDRRGTRHDIRVVRSNRAEFQTNVLFFSGESGLPVFNRRGRVVGVVKGNELAPLRTGLVARLDALKIPNSVRGRLALPLAKFRVVPSVTILSNAGVESLLELRTEEAMPSKDEKGCQDDEQTLSGSPEPLWGAPADR